MNQKHLLAVLAVIIASLTSSCASYCKHVQPDTTICRFQNVTRDLKKISNLPTYDWKFNRLKTTSPQLQWQLKNRIATISISDSLINETENNNELALLLTQAMAHISLRHPDSANFKTYDDLKVREADRLGMAYASRVIYDPRPAKALWIRLSKKYKGSPYIGYTWNAGRDETYTWNIEPIMRLYNGRKNNTVN